MDTRKLQQYKLRTPIEWLDLTGVGFFEVRSKYFTPEHLYQSKMNNFDYYHGDTWQSWIGPKIAITTPQHAEVMAEVQRVFQTANKIQEVVDRHRRALVGKQPLWYFTNPDGQRAEATEADAVLQKLVDRWSRRKNPLVQAVTSMLVEGKGYLRLWSPPQLARAKNIQDRLFVHAPQPASVEIKRDNDGFIEYILYRYVDKNMSPLTEKQYLNEQGFTVFETLQGGAVNQDETIVLDLGGGYSIVELEREPLITDSVKRAQNGINYALTMLLRNLSYSGFLRELILNGQPPGEWVEDRNSASGQKFIPSPEGFESGPGVTNFVMGAPTYDSAGNITGYTSPQVNVRQPIDPKIFLETVQTESKIIYEAVGQGHILATDAQLSGVSRVQLRQDFLTALGEDAQIISGALAEIYKSALLMLGQGTAGLDLVVKCQFAVSQATPEEMQEIRENYSAGLLSRATAMGLLGVDNPDAEAELIEEERSSQMAPVPTFDYPGGLDDSTPSPEPAGAV